MLLYCLREDAVDVLLSMGATDADRASYDARIQSSCRTIRCIKQVEKESESSNARVKLRLESKQGSIDHHHDYKC